MNWFCGIGKHLIWEKYLNRLARHNLLVVLSRKFSFFITKLAMADFDLTTGSDPAAEFLERERQQMADLGLDTLNLNSVPNGGPSFTDSILSLYYLF